MHSIAVTIVVSMLLSLIHIGSPVALDDCLSMAVSGIYLSYLVVVVLLLYRRTTGAIFRYDYNEDDIVNVPGAQLKWGPFNCPGILGIINNAFAAIYVAISLFFSFWPSQMNPSAGQMNWSIVGIGGGSTIAALYYFVWARHIYRGPVLELER